MREFEYICPDTVDAAVTALLGGEARALAGGTDLVPQIREGRRRADRIVDLKRIKEMTAIAVRPDGGVTIGAAATATAVSQHPAVAVTYPAIAQSVRLIGGVQVQNRASLGGNICNAAPSADAVPALLCHDARAVIASQSGRREIALAELFQGPGRTILKPGELLVAIVLHSPAPRTAAAYHRFTPRREMDIAIAGAAALITLDAQGVITSARVVLASVAPTAIRSPLAEDRLLGERPTPALFADAGRLAAQDARPIFDTRSSADYRRQLVSVLTARALNDCWNQLQTRSGAV